MFHKTLLFSALTVLFGLSSAHATEGSSEFFVQAPADLNMVQPHVGYTSMSSTVTGAKSTTTSGMSNLGASYERGLSDSWAVGIDLSTSSLSSSPSDGTSSSRIGSTSGLNDILIGAAGLTRMDAGNLHYGLFLTESLGDAKADQYGHLTTNQSGGMGLAPFVGWDMQAGPGWFGAALKYDYLMERTVDTDGGGKVKFDNGSVMEVTVYYEYTLAPDTPLGLKLVYDNVANVTEKVTGQADATLKMGSWFSPGLYTRIPTDKGQWLLVGVDYMNHSGSDYYSNNGNQGSLHSFDINATYRLVF